MEKDRIKDLVLTFLNLLWRLVSGPIQLLLLPFYLTETQQGYWYLFGSIAALNTFADLGFSNIILQFSAHGYAYLTYGKEGLVGELPYIQSLGSFFRFIVQWIATMCAVVYPVIFCVGIFFFFRDGVLFTYFIPWVVYSIGSLVNFFNNSILSFIEGMNQIAKIQKARLIVAVLNTIIIVLCLFFRLHIYALAFAMFISASFMFITIFYTFGNVVEQLWKVSHNFIYPWSKEILPLFKKYVLSFASGYLIFQIYVPLMHYFHGPIYSGKVGISLSLVNAMYSFSNIWVYTIIPQINIYIEQRKWKILDKVFTKRLLLCCITYVFVCICLVIFLKIFGCVSIIQRIILRFLSWKGLCILILCYLFQLLVNAWAVYLRGHKQEPYWCISIFSAIWIFVITIVMGNFFPPELFFLGLLSHYVWVLPIAYIIYKNKKRLWHNV